MSAAKTNRTSVVIHNTLGLVVHVYYNIYASSMQRVNLRKLACVSSLGPLSRWHVLFWPNRLGPTRNRSDGLSQSWPVSALSGCTCRQSLRLILSSKLGRGPGRMTPLSNHHDRPGAWPGFSLTLGESCVNSGRQGTAGPGPPDSPIRPSRSPSHSQDSPPLQGRSEYIHTQRVRQSGSCVP